MRHGAHIPENMTFGLHIRKGEFDFSVDPARSNQSRVQRLDLICSHDHFDISPCVKSIQLIEKLQHGSLDFAFAP